MVAQLLYFVRVLVLFSAAVAFSAASCLGVGHGGSTFDGHTRYMWARTWHGPNALATPLNQYYMPRTPGNCNSDSYMGVTGCQSCVSAGIAGPYGGLPYPVNAAVGFEPAQFERLGRVPNELDLGGALALPANGPAPPPRR